jgi:hypothetical protein
LGVSPQEGTVHLLGGELAMRRYFTFLLLGLLVVGITSCADSEPTEPEMLEILDSLESSVNEQDLEGVVALFAENAVWDESFKNQTFEGIENVEFNWEVYFLTPVTSEFRDISVDGDTATFTWVETRPAFNKIWPTAFIGVHSGKITRIEWLEDAVRELTGEE